MSGCVYVCVCQRERSLAAAAQAPGRPVDGWRADEQRGGESKTESRQPLRKTGMGAWPVVWGVVTRLGAWPWCGGVAPGVRRAQTLRREMEKEKEEEKHRDEEAGRAGLWDHADQAAGTPARCVIGWFQALRGET